MSCGNRIPSNVKHTHYKTIDTAARKFLNRYDDFFHSIERTVKQIAKMSCPVTESKIRVYNFMLGSFGHLSVETLLCSFGALRM